MKISKLHLSTLMVITVLLGCSEEPIPLVVIDLIDQVKGYTMKFLNDNVLPHAYGLSSLKTTLKANLVSGVTAEQIDLLFELYQNLPER